jgi:membrane associated rhomboid family serine protease
LINENLIFSRFGLIPAFVGQEPWTLFTYMFLHAGIWHLVGNMITLYFFGIYVIALIGETNFLTTYFIGGIVGGLLFFVLSPVLGTTNDIVVGASGAIYALGGVLVAMVPKVKVYTLPLPIPLPLWVVIIFGFLITMMLSLEVSLAVAWQAHLGGLVYGLAIGYYFRTRRQRRY